MKLISWNVRRLGGVEKRKEVRKLVAEKNPFILCLQETKQAVYDDILSMSLWGDSNHAYSYRSSLGASRGLLTLWDTLEVEVWSSVSFEHVLQIHGRFIQTNDVFYLFNIYTPCDPRASQELWVSMSKKLQMLRGEKVCVCGDFNAVRNLEVHRSLRGGNVVQVTPHFSMFIEDNRLIDLPLCSCRYTWFKGDGTSMSRLDHYLVSEEWCLHWPNCFQVALLRGLSDHCPIQLSVDEEKWGPRPSRMLKCWQELPGYKQFVKEKWHSYHIEGWGGFVIREKLKLIRQALKEWHSVHVKNISGKIDI